MNSLRNHFDRLALVGLLAVVVTVGTAISAHSTSPSARTVAPPEVASANNLSAAFRFAAGKVLPSVVTIETRPSLAQTSGDDENGAYEQSRDNPFRGTPFEDLIPGLGDNFRFDRPSPPGKGASGLGSGVIIDATGLILTNNHVVAGGGDVTVRLADGREFKAAEVLTDSKTDIALVKIEGAKDMVAATLGDSAKVEIGDWVLALGQPFGLESTVTAGIISAKQRGIGIAPRESFLQTDAAINPGNSGGPLVNLQGEVIGINTAISSRSGGSEGIGFAVPINLAHWVADQLRTDGTVHRAYLGVSIQTMNAKLAEQFHVQPREGVVVTNVFPKTPAAKAGLQAGDIIVHLDGTAIHTPQQLQMVVEESAVGNSLTLDVIRDGKHLNLKFSPEEQPETYGVPVSFQNESQQPSTDTTQITQYGLSIDTFDTATAHAMGMDNVKGVLITSVRRDSTADRAGLTGGMVITHINRHPVSSVGEAQKELTNEVAEAGVLLLVRSESGSQFVVLRP